MRLKWVKVQITMHSAGWDIFCPVYWKWIPFDGRQYTRGAKESAGRRLTRGCGNMHPGKQQFVRHCRWYSAVWVRKALSGGKLNWRWLWILPWMETWNTSVGRRWLMNQNNYKNSFAVVAWQQQQCYYYNILIFGIWKYFHPAYCEIAVKHYSTMAGAVLPPSCLET